MGSHPRPRGQWHRFSVSTSPGNGNEYSSNGRNCLSTSSSGSSRASPSSTTRAIARRSCAVAVAILAMPRKVDPDSRSRSCATSGPPPSQYHARAGTLARQAAVVNQLVGRRGGLAEPGSGPSQGEGHGCESRRPLVTKVLLRAWSGAPTRVSAQSDDAPRHTSVGVASTRSAGRTPRYGTSMSRTRRRALVRPFWESSRLHWLVVTAAPRFGADRTGHR
jgi:hypothetical protein